MLRVTGVTKDDIVYDLGCGDGRLVITAAKRYGARGVGIDIDQQRISESRDNARQADVTDRVRFLEQDLFEADIRQATVVTLYLLPKLNVQLRPKLYTTCDPAHASSRMTSIWQNGNPIGRYGSGAIAAHTVYYWVVPADVGGVCGTCECPRAPERPYVLRLQQEFQVVRGTIGTEGLDTPISNASLVGDRLLFTASTDGQGQMFFDGRVDTNLMHGRVEIKGGLGRVCLTGPRSARLPDGESAPR